MDRKQFSAGEPGTPRTDAETLASLEGMILGAIALALFSVSHADRPQLQTIDGVTFHADRNRLYVPVRKLAASFGLPIAFENRTLLLNGRPVDPSRVRKLFDGTSLIAVGDLDGFGLGANWDSKTKLATMKLKSNPGKAVNVRRGDQRVVVNKAHLQIVAWQGASVVFRSTVGIGREGFQTPSGNFKVQPYRTKMHRSSLYNDTPMPWSVHIVGNIFIHGSDVARGRSSHGCIRLPVTGNNAAKWFYEWVELGTPVAIQGNWPAGAKV